MSLQKGKLEDLLAQAKDHLKHSPEMVHYWLSRAEAYLSAASDLTKDELALIESYLKQDLEQFQPKSFSDVEKQAIQTLVKAQVLSSLLEITDKTQLEWLSIFEDIHHHGIYQAGEVVGIGIYVCEDCHDELPILQSGILEQCRCCGGIKFSRSAFPV